MVPGRLGLVVTHSWSATEIRTPGLPAPAGSEPQGWAPLVALIWPSRMSQCSGIEKLFQEAPGSRLLWVGPLCNSAAGENVERCPQQLVHPQPCPPDPSRREWSMLGLGWDLPRLRRPVLPELLWGHLHSFSAHSGTLSLSPAGGTG